MDWFCYRQGHAYCEDEPLARLADHYGTPLYVYSGATLRRHCENFVQAFQSYPTLACFAVKACSNMALLRMIGESGLGADIVSVGELERAVQAGIDPSRIVFSGVGKQVHEMQRAVDLEIYAFNVESDFELAQLNQAAGEMGKRARVSLRVNPHIDAKTNPKIATGLHSTKFGMTEDSADALLLNWSLYPHLDLVGMSCHIGSQILDLQPLRQAAESMARMARRLHDRGHALEFIDMGGGLGIRYKEEIPPTLEEYAQTLIDVLKPTGLRLLVEPGRVIAGNAGIMLTRVLGVKDTGQKRFVIVDGAMNDLLRPTLYESFHDILPAEQPDDQGSEQLVDVVGPICETGDFLGLDRKLGFVKEGDLLFVRGTGAYAASMASQYNSRPRAAEVLIDQNKVNLIRRRETLSDLWALEQEP